MILKKHNHTISYSQFDTVEQLTDGEQKLLSAAQKATETAYAPYSNFFVGASVLLENGTIITGSNQENGAYPSGLCAERVALFHYGSLGSNVKIEAIGIAATRNRLTFLPCSPCGACRQVMQEYEMIQKTDIKVLFLTTEGRILLFDSVKDILPFAFVL